MSDLVERLLPIKKVIAPFVGLSWLRIIDEAASDLTAKDNEIEALRANQEREWCTICGTVTRDRECDCTIHGTCSDPNFVNYADAMQKASYAATQDMYAAIARAETAERERDEARADAERYRYLRSRDLDTIDKGGVFAGMTPKNTVLNFEDLDREVDAARAVIKQEE